MQTRRQSFFLILALGILNALTPFSIDLYLPAFTEIARDLQTLVPRVSLSVSAYFVGFALGQIFYGPLLDRFGRKRPIYAGLALYILASVGCMNANSVEMLIVFRFISALGGCAASVGATAMVRDYFPPTDGAKVFSMLMLVLSVSPLLAPTIGSMLVAVWGWRSLFIVLSGLAVVDFFLIFFLLPNAYVPDPTVSLNLIPILRNFSRILRVSQFWVYTSAGSLAFAGLFVYVAGSPAIFMDGFGVGPKVFGIIFAILASGMIGGGQLNRIFVKKYGSKLVFQYVLIIQVICAGIFFLGSIVSNLGLLTTTTFLFIILTCAGTTYPNAAALALEPFSRNIGSASALLGFLQLGVGAVAAALVGLLDTKGTLPTAAVTSVFSTLALIVLLMNSKNLHSTRL